MLENNQGLNRDFKGVWIPAKIWLDKSLTVTEKLFLVEIDSLDNKDGCFAMNAYFADFFGISKGRCTQIIKSLESKGFISVHIQKAGVQVTKRVLRVLNNQYAKTKLTSLENDEGNNTKKPFPHFPENDGSIPLVEKCYITKKGRKLTGPALSSFEEFWETYDLKKDKANTADSWWNIKPNPDLAVKIIAAAKIEASRRPDMLANGQTPKWAQGWLSSRRWEDEDYQPKLTYEDRKYQNGAIVRIWSDGREERIREADK